MSDSDLRDEPADEVLDLYDVLPERTEARHAETEDDPLTSMIKNTGRNFAAIMGMFAVSLAAFIAVRRSSVSDWDCWSWWSGCSSWLAA
jgi:hypothetical protein